MRGSFCDNCGAKWDSSSEYCMQCLEKREYAHGPDPAPVAEPFAATVAPAPNVNADTVARGIMALFQWGFCMASIALLAFFLSPLTAMLFFHDLHMFGLAWLLLAAPLMWAFNRLYWQNVRI